MHKLIVFSLLFTCGQLIISASAIAQNFQKNWLPNQYRVVCNEPQKCILEQRGRELTESLMPQAVDTIRSMGFSAPQLWGQRKLWGTPDAHIELYETDTGGIASAAIFTSSIGPERAKMFIGKGIEQYTGKQFLPFYFMSHELFHIIGYDTMVSLEHSFDAAKRVPGWIYEGMATAIGVEATRKRYPDLFPPMTDVRIARNFSGLRRYYLPLPHRRKYETTGLESNAAMGQELWTGDYDSYRTSSFWQHLAKVHYDNNYTFMARYLDTAAKRLDWAGWLKGQLEADTGLSLGKVFAGFLADYANWSGPGFPGALFKMEYWLKESFDGCQILKLNKNSRHASAEVELLPLSGRCIEVHVEGPGDSGLKNTEDASIQIAAEATGNKGVEGLHLSLAASNDHRQFNCAKVLKKTGKNALRNCIFEPRKGGIEVPGTTASGKVWNIRAGAGGQRLITLDSGHQSELRQQLSPQQRLGSHKRTLVNRYILSYTPENVSTEDTRDGGRNPVNARFHFVLDIGIEQAEMGVGSGNFEVPDVDQPLPIEFDHLSAELQRGQHRQDGDRFIGIKDYEGLIDPCFLVFQFRNSKTNESLYFKIMQSGAFTPGEYTFANRVPHHRDTTYRIERQYPGLVLGTYQYLDQGWKSVKSFSISAGTLTIKSIAGAFITGHVEAYGSRMEWSSKRQQSEVIQQTALGARFSVDVSNSYGYKFGKDKYSCLSPATPPDRQRTGSPPWRRSPQTQETPAELPSSEPAESSEKNTETGLNNGYPAARQDDGQESMPAAAASAQSEEEMLRNRYAEHLEAQLPGPAGKEDREYFLKIFDQQQTLAAKKYWLELSGVEL